MSGWSAFTDIVLSGDNKKGALLSAAAIYGQNGAKWDENGITVDTKEIDALVAGLKDQSKFQEKGIHVGGVKYMYLSKTTLSKNDGYVQVIGKKGGNSVLLRLSKTAVVIGITKEGTNVANVISVDYIADDLISKGF